MAEMIAVRYIGGAPDSPEVINTGQPNGLVAKGDVVLAPADTADGWPASWEIVQGPTEVSDEDLSAYNADRLRRSAQLAADYVPPEFRAHGINPDHPDETVEDYAARIFAAANERAAAAWRVTPAAIAEDHSAAELREMARESGLPAGGSKADLAERLAGTPAVAGDYAPPTPATSGGEPIRETTVVSTGDAGQEGN